VDFSELRLRAAALNRSTVAGDLANAYRLLLDLPAEEACRVLLLAGYSIVGHNDRRFWGPRPRVELPRPVSAESTAWP
jgi:hypothetical protein